MHEKHVTVSSIVTRPGAKVQEREGGDGDNYHCDAILQQARAAKHSFMLAVPH